MSHALRSALTFLAGCLIFVGLPIIAWGPTDIPGLMGHPARLTFFIVVCILNAYAAIRIPEIGKRRAAAKSTVKRQHLAVILFQLLSIALMLVAPYCDRRGIAVMGEAEGTRYLGVVVYALAFLTMHLAEAHLGRQFSLEVAIQTDHRLVTEGVYRYLRHPRYMGIILLAVGIALVFRSWLALGLALPITLVVLWRIPVEELLMQREFHAEWDAYAMKTRRLIPFVY